jgi:hypothetical protein
MISRFQQAALLNNEGVKALVQRNPTWALRLFATSVKIMTTELTDMRSSSSSTNDHPTRLRSARAITVEIPSLRQGPFYSEDSDVFNRAIMIPTTHAVAEEREVTVEDDWFICYLDIYSAAIVFNLALTHHFMSSCHFVSSCGYAATSIMKAKKLYRVALELLLNTDNNVLLNMHAGLIIKLACVNNLMQIHQHGDDFHEKEERENYLRLHVSFLGQQEPPSSPGGSTNHQALLQEKTVKRLLINVMLLGFQKVLKKVGAAAA